MSTARVEERKRNLVYLAPVIHQVIYMCITLFSPKLSYFFHFIGKELRLKEIVI